jgi:crossover junction endodeoxyribonuclease RuvC
VIGIDPGTAVTGWGVLERRGGSVVHVAHGTIEPRSDASLAARLAMIHRALLDRCNEAAPDVLALEKSFVGKNVQSAFRLGEVRGVALLTAAVAGLAAFEYSPAEVKLAVAGSGRAEKPQVARAVCRELKLDEPIAPDAADALAIALCHAFTSPLLDVLAAATRGRVRRAPVIATTEPVR